MKLLKEYSKCKDGIQLSITVQKIGKDISITLTGGSNPHIGGVALATYGPIAHNTDHWTTSISLLTVSGHKEGELAMELSEKIARRLKATTVVSCGIHIDNATKEDIKKVILLANDLVDEVISAYNEEEK